MSWTAKRWIRTRVCWKNAVSVRGSFVSIALPSMKPDAQNQRQGSRPLGAAHKSGVGMCRWYPFHIHNPQKVKIDDRLFGQFGWDDYHHPSKEYCLLPKRYLSRFCQHNHVHRSSLTAKPSPGQACQSRCGSQVVGRDSWGETHPRGAPDTGSLYQAPSIDHEETWWSGRDGHVAGVPAMQETLFIWNLGGAFESLFLCESRWLNTPKRWFSHRSYGHLLSWWAR